MGWTPVNTLQIKRDFKTRQIIITWHDDVLGDKEERFTFEQKKEVIEFVDKTFNELCM